MKQRLKIILFATAAAMFYTVLNANAQQIAVWNETTKSYVGVKAGPGITVDLAAKTISTTAPAAKPRIYGTLVKFDATTNKWTVPFGAVPSSMTVFVNGLRYTLGIDYTLSAGTITPIVPSMMTADALVVADYDQQ